MTNRYEVNTVDNITVKKLLQIRKKEGKKIDPYTAEVNWRYVQILDPYGLNPELPEEYQQIGREYFARCPGSNISVSFTDLPATTRETLRDMHKSNLAFPAGLPFIGS